VTQNIELTTPTGVTLKLPVAGAGSRAYAYTIDWHIRIAVVLIWFFGWSQITNSSLFTDLPTMGDGRFWWLFAVPGLLYTLYHPLVELVMGGNSPGKNIANIACVNNNGETPSSGQILLRNFMRIIDALPVFYSVGLITLIISKDQVRLGDMAAGTRMVNIATRSDKALTKLEEIDRASIPPKDAELVQSLLERWGALSIPKRGELATTLLERHNVVPSRRQKLLKVQLSELLQQPLTSE